MREYPDHNYKAIWSNLKTIRLGEGKALELPADQSEFYDVGINTRCNAECSFCLEPNTLIDIADKQIPISDVKIGDLVYSFNEQTGDTELKTVEQVFERDYSGELIELEIDNRIIRLTPNHKVYTTNRGWVEANSLQLSDTLIKF